VIEKIRSILWRLCCRRASLIIDAKQIEIERLREPMSDRARLGMMIEETLLAEGFSLAAIAEAKRAAKCPLSEAEIEAIMALRQGAA
jgi:hypothetical protein